MAFVSELDRAEAEQYAYDGGYEVDRLGLASPARRLAIIRDTRVRDRTEYQRHLMAKLREDPEFRAQENERRRLRRRQLRAEGLDQ